MPRKKLNRSSNNGVSHWFISTSLSAALRTARKGANKRNIRTISKIPLWPGPTQGTKVRRRFWKKSFYIIQRAVHFTRTIVTNLTHLICLWAEKFAGTDFKIYLYALVVRRHLRMWAGVRDSKVFFISILFYIVGLSI